MMNKRKLFPVLFLTVILLSWLAFSPYRLAGYTKSVPRPDFSIHNLLNMQFQDNLEKYLVNHIPAITWLVYIKNDVYELLNLGQFHSGYSGQVIQGKNGILFEKNYLRDTFNNIPDENIRELAYLTAEKLKILQELLRRHSITLILVMAPSKVDFYYQDAPDNYTIRNITGLRGSHIIGPLFQHALDKADISFVNCYPEMAHQSHKDFVFTDTGIHWSMYGSALCLREITKKLHSLNPQKYKILEITGKIKTLKANYDERDIANLLNIWPRYSKGRNYFYLASFNKLYNPQAFIFLGDSFMGGLIKNMELSGYSTPELIFGEANKMPDKKKLFHALHSSDILFLVGNATKFLQPYFIKYADTLIDYLKEWEQN